MMETTKHRDYIDQAEDHRDLLQELIALAKNPESVDLGLDLEAEKKEAEAHFRRSQVLTKLKDLTGFDFAVYDASQMPGAAGFVKTNGEQTIYISDQTLDNPAFADHVAKHEAYHLRTMLVLPVETDFTAEHFDTLDHYLPTSFTENQFYLEGFNEALTAKNDEQDESVTAYGLNVAAAKQLEALALSATGKSLMMAFETGNHQAFAKILKVTTDRLMLHEALEAGDYDSEHKASLKQTLKKHEEPVSNPEKAAVIVEAWDAPLKAEKLKTLLQNDDNGAIKSLIETQLETEKKLALAA